MLCNHASHLESQRPQTAPMSKTIVTEERTVLTVTGTKSFQCYEKRVLWECEIMRMHR